MDYWRTEVAKAVAKMDCLKVINPVTYETLDIKLLRKYVDDILVALNEIRAGTRYDARNMGCLQFTWDSPHKNRSKMLSVLDTQMWVGGL